jgi:hypothetical protein
MFGNLKSLFRPSGAQAKERLAALESDLDQIAKGVSGRFYRGNAAAQLQMDLVESEEDLEQKRLQLITRRAPAAA